MCWRFPGRFEAEFEMFGGRGLFLLHSHSPYPHHCRSIEEIGVDSSLLREITVGFLRIPSELLSVVYKIAMEPYL